MHTTYRSPKFQTPRSVHLLEAFSARAVLAPRGAEDVVYVSYPTLSCGGFGSLVSLLVPAGRINAVIMVLPERPQAAAQ